MRLGNTRSTLPVASTLVGCTTVSDGTMPFPCMNKIHYSDFACWCSCIGNSRMPARTPYRSNICNALLVDVFIGNLWDRLSDFIPETIICECGGYSYCTTVHSWQCHRLHAPQNKPSNIVTSYSYRFLSVTILTTEMVVK